MYIYVYLYMVSIRTCMYTYIHIRQDEEGDVELYQIISMVVKALIHSIPAKSPPPALAEHPLCSSVIGGSHGDDDLLSSYGRNSTCHATCGGTVSARLVTVVVESQSDRPLPDSQEPPKDSWLQKKLAELARASNDTPLHTLP
jgi:hypothetical protein